MVLLSPSAGHRSGTSAAGEPERRCWGWCDRMPVLICSFYCITLNVTAEAPLFLCHSINSFAFLDYWTTHLGILILQYLTKLQGHPSSQCLICTHCWVCPLCIKTKHFFLRVFLQMTVGWLFLFRGTSLKALGQGWGSYDFLACWKYPALSPRETMLMLNP